MEAIRRPRLAAREFASRAEQKEYTPKLLCKEETVTVGIPAWLLLPYLKHLRHNRALAMFCVCVHILVGYSKVNMWPCRIHSLSIAMYCSVLCMCVHTSRVQ